MNMYVSICMWALASAYTNTTKNNESMNDTILLDLVAQAMQAVYTLNYVYLIHRLQVNTLPWPVTRRLLPGF